MRELEIARRRFVAFGAATTAVAGAAMCGCAAGPDGLPPTLAPKIVWPGPADFQEFRFLFHSVRFADGYDTRFARVDVGSPIVVIDVSVTNTSDVPRPYQHQPYYSIHDLGGAEYGADLQHTVRINMGRPGRRDVGSSMNPNVPARSEIVFLVPKRARYYADVAVPSPYGGSGRFFRMDMGRALGYDTP